MVSSHGFDRAWISYVLVYLAEVIYVGFPTYSSYTNAHATALAAAFVCPKTMTSQSANDERKKLIMLLYNRNISMGKDGLSNSMGDVVPNLGSSMHVLPRGDPNMLLKVPFFNLLECCFLYKSVNFYSSCESGSMGSFNQYPYPFFKSIPIAIVNPSTNHTHYR